MRIIAGRYKGRRLDAPTWPGLRPTSDKLRETLFNVLQHEVAGARVLDGFAGTGAVGIEALSRGAVHVTFVERDRRACALIEGNLRACRVTEGYTIVRADFVAAAARAEGRFDLIVVDPPYEERDLGAIVGAGAKRLTATGLLVLEHAVRRDAPALDGVSRVRLLKSGDSALSFYTRVTSDIDS
jgi:16S rRNA (guanine966-N2)-methyltransferase